MREKVVKGFIVKGTVRETGAVRVLSQRFACVSAAEEFKRLAEKDSKYERCFVTESEGLLPKRYENGFA